MKYVLWFLILAVLAGGGAAYWYTRENSAAASTANIQTDQVVRRNLEQIVQANGKVASNRDVDIKCQASGKVIKLPFDISNRVKTGDLLLELDPVDQQRACDQADSQLRASNARLAQTKVNQQLAVMNLVTSRQRAEADLASSKAKVSDAKNKAERVLALFNATPALASKEELETAQTTAAAAEASAQSAEAAIAELDQQKVALDSKQQDIETAQAQVDQDAAKKKLADQQLEYTKVFVPEDESGKTADYRIASLGVQLGSVVQSGSSGNNGGTTVMTLSDMSHMYVLASVDESDIGQIADPERGGTGQAAHITVDAYPGQQFAGQVVRVATKGVNTSNVVTFEVKIEVTDEARALLRPEMTATAKIVIDSRSQVLAVPVVSFTRGQADNNGANGRGGATRPAAADDAGAATQPISAALPDATTRPADAQQGGGGRGRRGGGGGGGGRGGRGGGGRNGGQANKSAGPLLGTVNIVKEDHSLDPHNVSVGMTDGEYYEVLSGLEEGDVVQRKESGTESRFRNNQNQNGPGGGLIPRGFTGGGGGGRGR